MVLLIGQLLSNTGSVIVLPTIWFSEVVLVVAIIKL